MLHTKKAPVRREEMMSLLKACLFTSCLALVVEGSMKHVDVSGQGSIRKFSLPSNNSTTPSDPFQQLTEFREWKKEEAPRRKDRMKDRRTRAKEFLQRIPQPDADLLELVSKEELSRMEDDQKKRGLSWFGNSDTDAYSAGILVNPSEEYDKWAQAYRMLGGFIDCDHQSGDDQKSGSGENNNNNNNDNGGTSCSRWMMWAAVSATLGSGI
jgi:hypothetical protein